MPTPAPPDFSYQATPSTASGVPIRRKNSASGKRTCCHSSVVVIRSTIWWHWPLESTTRSVTVSACGYLSHSDSSPTSVSGKRLPNWTYWPPPVKPPYSFSEGLPSWVTPWSTVRLPVAPGNS